MRLNELLYTVNFKINLLTSKQQPSESLLQRVFAFQALNLNLEGAQQIFLWCGKGQLHVHVLTMRTI